MIDDRLKSYVNECRRLGKSDDQIRQALLGAGWSVADVDTALSFVSPQANTNVTPAILIPQPTQTTSLSTNVETIQKTSSKLPVPGGVKFISVLGFIFSFLAIVFGVLAVAASFFFSSLTNSIPLLFKPLASIGSSAFLIIGPSLFGLGIILFLVSKGLWRGMNWARMFTAVFSGANIAWSVVSLVRDQKIQTIFTIIIYLAIIGYLFLSKSARTVFSSKEARQSEKKKLIFFLSLTLLLVAAITMVPRYILQNKAQELQNTSSAPPPSAGGVTATPPTAETTQRNPVDEAWDVFQRYLSTLKAHGTDFKSIVYFPERVDTAQCIEKLSKVQCDKLTDLVYEETSKISKESLVNQTFDTKQVILFTNPTRGSIPNSYSVNYLLFARDEKGILKFVEAKELSAPSIEDLRDSDQDGLPDKQELCGGIYKYDPKCKKTDPYTKDTDGNGWWDGIDAAFVSPSLR